MEFSFILLAGGDSDRFKSVIPKQYHKIAGKTLIDISISKIKEIKKIKEIVLVYNKKHKKYLKDVNLQNLKLIEGGGTRQESTCNALNYLRKKKNLSKVLIHDAARPNFSRQLIKNILTNSRVNRTVIPVLKLQDALKEKNHKNKFLSLKRNNYFLTQTPQCYNLDEILQLHNEQNNKYRDDDFSLIKTSDKVKFIVVRKKTLK